ncbi:glycosyltransferase [Thermoanaerobacterium sp. RBIITD]|uniref:MGDG synthase family glycosyltransferase n=1 Tax=Thermoanaerobacterium sp. RBIITD TaxID=1550240 RepID=UPI000BB6E44D|nr:glycosyltransferase [Thermoanaerobacterium sp. RBIITD]SNX53985.1 processive 1,2-diacylglycerol beta-glucosyltransferase [Thermoanaerobacterium sp. RBIITD]
MDKIRILILYEDIGTGHKRTAMALKKAFEKRENVEAIVANPFGEKFPGLANLTTQIYLKTLKLTPDLWGYLYEMERDKIERKINKLVGISIYTFIKDYVLSCNPDAVICTHPFSCSILSHVKRNLDIPIYAILTDYDVHAYWIHHHIDGYFVGCSEMKTQMENMGVPDSKVYVTGIPIDEVFYVKKDKSDMRQKLGFSIDKPLVLVMGGGLGLGNIKKAVKVIQEYDNIQIAVICGFNKNLKEKLEEIAKENVVVYGHVDNVHEFMEAADVLITKSGGLTVTEAISKGLPMVVFDPIPGQEERNLEFLLKKKIAIRIKDIDKLDKKIIDLLNDNTKLKGMKERMAELSVYDSADRVCSIVINNIKNDVMKV